MRVRARPEGNDREHVGERMDISRAERQLSDEGCSVALRWIDGRLTLTDGEQALCGDFARLLPRVKPGKLQRELLVRAAKAKGTASPTAFDATAGLGEDSFLLAAAGFTVQLHENDPVIAALLRDALTRAAADPAFSAIAARMRLVEGDSVAALSAIAAADGAARSDNAASDPSAMGNATVLAASPAPFDVVYLDPMFPERSKSAAVKKKFQLLHHLERPCANEEELLRAAIAAAPRKVVIKRPVKGPWLAGIKPSYAIAGKAVRYDVIVPASIGGSALV